MNSLLSTPSWSCIKQQLVFALSIGHRDRREGEKLSAIYLSAIHMIPSHCSLAGAGMTAVGYTQSSVLSPPLRNCQRYKSLLGLGWFPLVQGLPSRVTAFQCFGFPPFGGKLLHSHQPWLVGGTLALSLPRRDTADAQCLGTHPKYLHDEALWLGKVQQCVHCVHAGVFFPWLFCVSVIWLSFQELWFAWWALCVWCCSDQWML